ncbi:MAG: hypothetical protein U9N82_08455 [Thermodesulfobacteriota bacterium]|nr:hypothetical protein [Thermodesulfobacteriota bacterium]
MEVQQDFKEVLELFNANKLEYVIVGGYVLAGALDAKAGAFIQGSTKIFL